MAGAAGSGARSCQASRRLGLRLSGQLPAGPEPAARRRFRHQARAALTLESAGAKLRPHAPFLMVRHTEACSRKCATRAQACEPKGPRVRRTTIGRPKEDRPKAAVSRTPMRHPHPDYVFDVLPIEGRPELWTWIAYQRDRRTIHRTAHVPFACRRGARLSASVTLALETSCALSSPPLSS